LELVTYLGLNRLLKGEFEAMERGICIVGILVDERANHAPEVQQVLTKHGSQILSRNGIPDPGRQRGI